MDTKANQAPEEKQATDPKTGPGPKIRTAYLLAFLLLAFPVLYSIDWNIITDKFWTYRLTLGAPALFLFLALVPGVLAVVYHLVTVVERRGQNQKALDAYYLWLDQRARAHRKGLKRAEEATPGAPSARTRRPSCSWPSSSSWPSSPRIRK